MNKNEQTPETTRAPIRATAARYEWGDWRVEVIDGADATMIVTHTKSYDQRDDRAYRTSLDVPMGEVADVMRMMAHALDSREERNP